MTFSFSNPFGVLDNPTKAGIVLGVMFLVGLIIIIDLQKAILKKASDKERKE